MEEHGNLIWLSVEEYRQLVEDRAVYLNKSVDLQEEVDGLHEHIDKLDEENEGLRKALGEATGMILNIIVDSVKYKIGGTDDE